MRRLRFRAMRTRGRLVLAVPLVVLAAAAAYLGARVWAYYASHVTTDNAYVRADVAQITPRIAGVAAEVLVEENWWVKTAQVLLRLDSQDYEVRASAARAGLARARETVDRLFAALEAARERQEAARAQIEAARAATNEAGAEFRLARRDFERARTLFEEEVVSAQSFDRARARYEIARARLRTRKREFDEAQKVAATRAMELAEARAALGGEPGAARYERAVVAQAEAALREADLNLSYCTLTSPIEGVVSRKSVEVGQRVAPGQPLMAVVPLQDAYVEANFKETQLTHVRVGQPAEVRADIYPGHVFAGRVESLSAGTGAAFSLLPPENATGNWVKVVQRLPVKIILDEPLPAARPLRVGLSVEVTIDTGKREGALLTALRQESAQNGPLRRAPRTARANPLASGSTSGPAVGVRSEGVR